MDPLVRSHRKTDATLKLRVAVVALGSPRSQSSWSGIPFFALKEIERRFEQVEVIDTPRIDECFRRLSGLARLGVLLTREPLVSRLFGRYLDRRLAQVNPDFVISIGAAHKLAFLDRRWPIVHVADGFYQQIIDFYPKYRRLSRRSRSLGDRIQRSLFDRCTLVMPTSDWAADCALGDYGVDPSRIMVTPIGANLDHFPPSPALRPCTGQLRLLFAGFDWDRKGGPIVLETFRLLRARSVDVELHVAGCSPQIDDAGAVVHGRVDKPELEALYRNASFFFMPSRQEAFGLVYCEAAAFGLPSIATRTGGVPAIVEDGSSGLLLSPEAGAQDYADAIMSVWGDEPVYAGLQREARNAFETRLNWGAWGAALVQRLGTLGEK